jgi:outer membrane protein
LHFIFSIFLYLCVRKLKPQKNVKNISIVVNVVLLVAVAVLFYLHFSRPSHSSGDSNMAETGTMPELAIAYVNSDTLTANYEYFKEMEQKLQVTAEKLEAEYQNRAEGLQREISSYQTTAGNMTPNQARAVEEDLRKKQQNLMMYQEQIGQQLRQEEVERSSALYDKLAEYLKGYASENDLQMVLTYSKGSAILFASDSLDITKQVIAGLNEAYKAEKNSPAAESDTTPAK